MFECLVQSSSQLGGVQSSITGQNHFHEVKTTIKKLCFRLAVLTLVTYNKQKHVQADIDIRADPQC